MRPRSFLRKHFESSRKKICHLLKHSLILKTIESTSRVDKSSTYFQSCKRSNQKFRLKSCECFDRFESPILKCAWILEDGTLSRTWSIKKHMIKELWKRRICETIIRSNTDAEIPHSLGIFDELWQPIF